MHRQRQRHRKGFTVVEALAAGVILAISAAVIGTSVSQALASLQLARDYQLAAELLDATLTKIDLIGPVRLVWEGPTEGQFPPPLDRFTWQADIDARLEGSLYEVTVRILWQTATGQRSVQAQTLLNDPLNSRKAELDWEHL